LNFPLGESVHSFRDFHVISFANFVSGAADVEGRLAVQNDGFLNGYAIGMQLQTTFYERSLPYSLVVGRDLNFTAGSVHPDGTNRPFPGAQEDIFAGSHFYGDSYLESRSTSCNGDTLCLNPSFAAAKRCYAQFRDQLEALQDNVEVSLRYGGILMKCLNNEDDMHVASVYPNQFAQSTYFTLENCNFQAKWVINIRGFEDVVSTGDNFPANPGAVVFNFVGTGRLLTIQNSWWGAILAPFNSVKNLGGVVVGKIIA